MRYPVAIEVGDKKHAYGVVVPDLPGCYSAGYTLEEALSNAQEAILLHLDGLLADQQAIPVPSPLAGLQRRRDFKGRTWAVVDVDLSELRTKPRTLTLRFPNASCGWSTPMRNAAAKRARGFSLAPPLTPCGSRRSSAHSFPNCGRTSLSTDSVGGSSQLSAGNTQRLVFRRLERNGQVGERTICTDEVARTFKRIAGLSKLDPSRPVSRRRPLP